MTMEWAARSVRQPQGRVLLCGRQDRASGRYVCPDVIGAIAEEGTAYWDLDTPPEHDRAAVWLKAGLTDAETPGRYRWSRWAMDKIKAGRRPGFREHHEQGSRAVTLFPVVVPCIRGHLSRIDAPDASR